MPWTYEDESVIISGEADYTLLYGNPGSLDTNLIVVAAKGFDMVGISLCQMLSHMGMYAERNFIVYSVRSGIICLRSN